MASASNFAAFFNATPAACMVMAQDFTIVAVNDAHLESTGAVGENIVGRHIFDAFPANPRDADGDGVSNVRASMLRVLETKQPDIMSVQRYDVPTRGRVEAGFTVRYWKPVHFPIFDNAGDVAYIVQHVENVTQQMIDQAQVDEMCAEISVQAQEISGLRVLLTCSSKHQHLWQC